VDVQGLTKTYKRTNLLSTSARGSSSGRTTGSGSVYRGSNPCPRTKNKPFTHQNLFFMSNKSKLFLFSSIGLVSILIIGGIGYTLYSRQTTTKMSEKSQDTAITREGNVTNANPTAPALLPIETSKSAQDTPSAQTQNEQKQATNANTDITKEVLAANNGLNGQKCYIEVSGTVYDATGNKEWKNGTHSKSRGQAKCGMQLTGVLANSPHGDSVLKELTTIGKLQ
jgi:predicted heme/steroid binding protein